MSEAPPPLGPVQLVMIPSADADRSVAFYRSLGFEPRNEQPWGDGYRWIELYPPTGDTGAVGATRRTALAHEPPDRDPCPRVIASLVLAKSKRK